MTSRLLRNAPLVGLAWAASACTGGRPSDSPEPQSAAERPLPQRAAERVDDGERYACADGSAITIDADARRATVTLRNGVAVDLPRAESASKGGGDVFVGETLSALRENGAVRLQSGAASAVECHAP